MTTPITPRQARSDPTGISLLEYVDRATEGLNEYLQETYKEGAGLIVDWFQIKCFVEARLDKDEDTPKYFGKNHRVNVLKALAIKFAGKGWSVGVKTIDGGPESLTFRDDDNIFYESVLPFREPRVTDPLMKGELSYYTRERSMHPWPSKYKVVRYSEGATPDDMPKSVCPATMANYYIEKSLIDELSETFK